MRRIVLITIAVVMTIGIGATAGSVAVSRGVIAMARGEVTIVDRVPLIFFDDSYFLSDGRMQIPTSIEPSASLSWFRAIDGEDGSCIYGEVLGGTLESTYCFIASPDDSGNWWMERADSRADLTTTMRDRYAVEVEGTKGPSPREWIWRDLVNE